MCSGYLLRTANPCHLQAFSNAESVFPEGLGAVRYGAHGTVSAYTVYAWSGNHGSESPKGPITPTAPTTQPPAARRVQSGTRSPLQNRTRDGERPRGRETFVNGRDEEGDAGSPSPPWPLSRFAT